MRTGLGPDGQQVIQVGEHIPALTIIFEYEARPHFFFGGPSDALDQRFFGWLTETYPLAAELLLELTDDE